MKENMIDETKEFEEPVEPKYDAVLHLEMYCVAEKMDMKELMSYAKSKCFRALVYEPQGFWPVVEMLYEVVPDHLVAELEDRLAETTIRKQEIFDEFQKTKLDEVKEAYPGLADQLIKHAYQIQRPGVQAYFKEEHAKKADEGMKVLQEGLQNLRQL
jgi:hypothetical protein